MQERLKNRIGKLNSQLSWVEARVAWRCTLRESTLHGFHSLEYGLGKELEMSLFGAKNSSISAQALLDHIYLFGDEEPSDGKNPGCTQLYTMEDAVKDWKIIISREDASAFDDAMRRPDGWVCRDYTLLYKNFGERGFALFPVGWPLPSDAEEILPKDSRSIYEQLMAAFYGVAQLDVLSKRTGYCRYVGDNAHGEKPVPSRLLFEGHETRSTCRFVFEGKAQDIPVALKSLWVLLADIH